MDSLSLEAIIQEYKVLPKSAKRIITSLSRKTPRTAQITRSGLGRGAVVMGAITNDQRESV